MLSLLLAIIYIAFISLGLPDSLLGAAWPVLHSEIGVPLSYAGIITMIISGGTILSSLMADRLIKKFGTGMLTAVSVALTAAALYGFSISNGFAWLCVFAVPYGLGAGAIDAALNNYVAVHYAARHMSWLHAMWGVGVSVSPYIMSYSLTGGGWHDGYRTVAALQAVLTVLMLVSLPLWRIKKETFASSKKERAKNVFAIKGVVSVLVCFFGYCALESTAGFWASSYLVLYRGIDENTAASFASLFYIGIMAGRFISGFVADRLGDRTLIRIGLAVISLGIVCVGLPLKINEVALCGLVLIGLGCAPIYPSIIHSTPHNFGTENSQKIVGIQMASAYVGSTFMPPLFGAVCELLPIAIYPLYLALFAVLMILMSEKLNKTVKSNCNSHA